MKLVGIVRLGRDAEFKVANSGKAMLKFSAAYNVGYGDDKKTQWINCTLFRDNAEKLQHHFTKGKQIMIWGNEPYNRMYTKRDGTNDVSLDVIVGDFEFVGSRQDGHDESPRQNPPLQPAPSVAAANIDDDIPF